MGCGSSTNQDSGAPTSQEYKSVFPKFKSIRVAQAAPSDAIYTLVGRIAGISGVLSCPYSQSDCALYRIDVEEYSKESGAWAHRYQEVRSADFFLMDPDATGSNVYISGSNTDIDILMKGKEEYGLSANTSHEIKELTPSIRSLLDRAKLPSDGSQRYRVRETALEANSQVAVIGVVTEGRSPNGATVRKLVPATQTSASADYRRDHNWTEAETAGWNRYCRNPRLIFSNDPAYFQGIVVNTLVGVVPLTNQPILDSKAPTAVCTRSNSPPPAKSNGKHIRTPVASKTIRVQVPPHAKPGSTVRVPGPDGNSMMVDVPVDCKPGEIITVSIS
mmetsp:Transcript_3656/g.5663  ORF Transcript_3656/g.5663 Transcript_3656/m.5663 type:complete len:332 (-) Transcript_3656:183-1178(-)